MRNEHRQFVTTLAKILEAESAPLFPPDEAYHPAPQDVKTISAVKNRGEAYACLDGEKFMKAVSRRSKLVDIVLGIGTRRSPFFLLADCKFRIKAGKTLTDVKCLRKFCEDLEKKFDAAAACFAAYPFPDGAVPIKSPLHVIFDQRVFAVAESNINRCRQAVFGRRRRGCGCRCGEGKYRYVVCSLAGFLKKLQLMA